MGLMLAVAGYAIGGGSSRSDQPIVEACPTPNKSVGHEPAAFLLLLGTPFGVALHSLFRPLGIPLAGPGGGLALVLCNAAFFTCAHLTQPGEHMPLKALFRRKLFWLFVLLMVCAGASEQAVSQWSSAFAEAALGVPKMVGDLTGPCLFALLMGAARLWYAKNSARASLRSYMLGSIVLCLAGYLLTALSPWPALGLLGCGLCGLSVGILWPGVFSLAAGSFPLGGTALFALLALGGIWAARWAHFGASPPTPPRAAARGHPHGAGIPGAVFGRAIAAPNEKDLTALSPKK